MMNQNKKNNGWILCSSKSFPGKFYYFNVVNGEAAWSLNDVENQNLKRDYRTHKIADNSHTFPEPSSPPMNDTPNISFANNSPFKKPIYNTIPKRVINNTQTPTFGQAIFPKYFEPYMPNIVWTPIQLPHPMYVSSAPDMGMKIPLDRIGHSFDPERSLFVETCDLSLSKRFEMYGKHSTVNKTVDNRNFLNKFYETSTLIKSGFDRNTMDNCQIFGSKESVSFQNQNEIKVKPFIREPVLRVRTRSVSENDSAVLSSIKKTNFTESLLITGNSASMKSTLTGGHNVENSSNNVKETLVDLDRNDLRFLLVAKRRKSVDLGDLHIGSEGKKIKTSKDEVPKTTPKKRVTFDLGDQVSSDGVDDQMENNIKTPEEETNEEDAEDSLVYIAMDLDTLLDEYDFIEEYTVSDDKRRLLIPHKLQAETEAVCLGDCRGRQRVIAARQITRKLVNPPPHYVVLPESADSPSSDQCLIVDNHSDNYILNTCLQVLNGGDQVMLITNNKDLYNDAKTLKIDCFKPQELKDGAGIAKPVVSFDLKKIKMNVTNEKKTNLFMQPASEFQPYLIKNKEEFPVNSFKKRLFDGNLEEENILPKTKRTFKNANTSPIDIKLSDERTDKLIDITRKKLPGTPQTIKSFDNPTTEIGLDMQNLFIKEKLNKNVVSTEKQNAKRFENGSVKQKKESKQKVSEPESSDRNSLDEILSVYSVKNKEMEENIKVRLDEWICCFTQLMENALIDVLAKLSLNTDKVSSHWVLYESIRTIQDLYGCHAEVNMVTEKLKDMLMNHSSSTGKIKSSIKPNDFVKLVGCGILLIKTLKSLEPTATLQETSNSLSTLLQDMSQPAPDIPTFTTPIITQSEHDTVREERRYYIKKPSEIIEYLKTHFPKWKDFQIPPDRDSENLNVVRTFGRDLKLLKIDNNKSIRLTTRTDNIMKAMNDNTVLNKGQISTKIDGISTISDGKLPELNSECDNGNTKFPPIVFKKFDSSFIFKTGKDKNKLTSTRDNINITENVVMFSNNNKSEVCDMTKTIENKEKIPSNLLTNENKNEPKIIRLFDNLFKQTNNEIVTTTNDDDLNVPKHLNTFDLSTETAGPKVIRTFDKLFLPKTSEKSFATPNIADLNVPPHGNTFNQENETAGPKVIRNIKPIEAFEENLKENSKMLDLDALDYSEIDMLETKDIDEESIAETETVSFVYTIKKQDKKTSIDKNVAEINDNALDNDYTYKNNDDSAFNNDVFINDNANDSVINNNMSAVSNDSGDELPINDETNDSGFENESLHAYSMVKIFLAELSGSVKAIYEFIVKSLNEFCEDDNHEEKRRMMHEKANKTNLIIGGIIDKLKSIIQRESNEGTSVRAMLLKAGVQSSSDKRMTRYRQVVMKCLEQAQVLQNTLKIVLVLTDDLHASISSVSDQPNNHYFNIFE